MIPMDQNDFRRLGYQLVDWIADYREGLERLPVRSQVQPGEVRAAFPDHPPQKGGRMDQALAALDRDVLPGITHWNHPSFFAYFPSNTVRIVGFEGARRGLERTLLSQMESPYFPISMREMPGNIAIRELADLDFHIGPVRVRAEFLNHPGICTGYRLFTSAGSISYLPDVELFRRFRENVGAGQPDIAYAAEKDERLREFIAGSEILIFDGQYDVEEYRSHVGWGHSCYEDVVELAMQAGVKRLFIFHHDPVHDDAWVRSMVDRCREMVRVAGSPLIVEAAREGLTVELSVAGTPVRLEVADVSV